MVTFVQNMAHQLNCPDPPANAIRHMTARIRRRWSPEERRMRALRAQIFQRLLLAR